MKKDTIAKIIYGICAVAFEAFMIYAEIRYENRGVTDPKGTSIAIFGDSVMAYAQDDYCVAERLAGYTGMEVTDLSFGGTTMAYTVEDSTLASDRNFLSMASIALAYAADDFALPRNYDSKAPATEYFDERERELEALDLKKTDIVIIEHCLNDYHCGVPIGDLNSDSIYTYLGALRTSVEKIRSINPNIRIIIVSPTSKWTPDGTSGSDFDFGGG